MPVQPGELLAGKYRVDGMLGSGGMGVVVSAVHETLRQRVAIKLLRANALADDELVVRFVREGQAAARLKSEHVARVLDSGTLPDGRPYLVIEHLEGHDLSRVVNDPRMLPVGEALDYVLQTCVGVAAAHAAGIVHRDLKPKNLFCVAAPNGKPIVKVLDFGISKIAGEPHDPSLTTTSHMLGSPSYMSPEQLRSSRYVDVRTDIWALGVILYELLTKQLPFRGENLTEVISVVLSDEPVPVHALRPDVPRELSAVVTRCLAKRLDDRFQSITDLVAALEPFATWPGVTSESASALARVRAATEPMAFSPLAHVGVRPSAPPLHEAPPTIAIGEPTSVAWGTSPVATQTESAGWKKLAAAAAVIALVGAGAAGWRLRARAHVATAASAPPAVAVAAPPPEPARPPVDAPSTAAPVASAPPEPVASAARPHAATRPPPKAKAVRATTSRVDDFSDIERH